MSHIHRSLQRRESPSISIDVTGSKSGNFQFASHTLFDSEPEETDDEGAVTKPQESFNDPNGRQGCYRAAQLQGVSEVTSLRLPHQHIPRGHYPPNKGAGSLMFLEKLRVPRGLNHCHIFRDDYERVLVQNVPLFVEDIEAARCVLLAPHPIPLKEFTSLRKKSEDRGGLIPVWWYPWVQPENTTTRSQAEDLLWRYP
ncbi:Hypothetical protein PHPALM_20571 [Phytophthora palmivora]|uniref:ATP-binding cassette (ABC) Superfamily n=1 Tax=Phytophthora palmivora TaxID=4796 RepID=A0A2P4XEJ4_9STRA|nr:Hypothetical protein PHPALM_20571 [Phytophthora palmivora]